MPAMHGQLPEEQPYFLLYMKQMTLRDGLQPARSSLVFHGPSRASRASVKDNERLEKNALIEVGDNGKRPQLR